MPNIKPISSLINYEEILEEVREGEPLFLSENGKTRYVVLDIKEYEKEKAILKLMSELYKGEKSVKEERTEFIEVKKILGISNE